MKRKRCLSCNVALIKRDTVEYENKWGKIIDGPYCRDCAPDRMF